MTESFNLALPLNIPFHVTSPPQSSLHPATPVWQKLPPEKNNLQAALKAYNWLQRVYDEKSLTQFRQDALWRPAQVQNCSSNESIFFERLSTTVFVKGTAVN